MEVIQSDHYLEHADELEKLRPLLENSPELKKEVEARQKRADILLTLQNRTGVKFDVVTAGAEAGTAAFVETATHRAFMVENTLENPEFALYAARHEAEHKRNKFYGVDFETELKPAQRLSLENSLGLELDSIDWVEGFNDYVTGSRWGYNHQSAYMQREVPAAQKLEALAREHLGVSLKDAFAAGNKALFYERVRELADTLQAKKILASLN